MNYKLNISYDGTEFCGWQIQPKVRTVQKELQDVIQNIFNDTLLDNTQTVNSQKFLTDVIAKILIF